MYYEILRIVDTPVSQSSSLRRCKVLSSKEIEWSGTLKEDDDDDDDDDDGINQGIIILSRIYNCTKSGSLPIGNAITESL